MIHYRYYMALLLCETMLPTILVKTQMRLKGEMTRQQMFNSEKTLNLHERKRSHCDPAQCIFPPALPCGRY